MSHLKFLYNSVELCSQSTKFIIFVFKAQLQAWSISHKYQEVPGATLRMKELIWTLDLSFKAVTYSEFGFVVKEMVIAGVCFLKLQNHFWNVFAETFVGVVHENEWTCSPASTRHRSPQCVHECRWCRRRQWELLPRARQMHTHNLQDYRKKRTDNSAFLLEGGSSSWLSGKYTCENPEHKPVSDTLSYKSAEQIPQYTNKALEKALFSLQIQSLVCRAERNGRAELPNTFLHVFYTWVAASTKPHILYSVSIAVYLIWTFYCMKVTVFIVITWKIKYEWNKIQCSLTFFKGCCI